MLAIKTVQTWNEMQSTNWIIVGRSPMFALDYIQPKLFLFLIFRNAMKRQQTIHQSTSTPQQHYNCIFVLVYSVNTTKIAANLTVLPTSRSRQSRVSACDVTVKRPIGVCVCVCSCALTCISKEGIKMFI